MSRNSILIVLLLLSIITLGGGVFCPQLPDLDIIVLVMAGSLAGAVLFRQRPQLVFLVILVVSSSLCRVWFLPHYPGPDDIDFYNDQNSSVTVIGTVCDEPDIRHTQAKYTICVRELLFDDISHPVSGRILLTTKRWPEYNYGDLLRVRGQLQTPFATLEFSYARYLSRYGIYSEMRYAHLQKIGTASAAGFYEFILNFKNHYAKIINLVFPEPQAAFLDGLLRGARKGLPEEVSLEFQKTGLTHIIAVSGFNITIVAASIMAVFGRLHRRLGVIMTVLGITFFVIFTGMSPAVIRAGLMGGIASFAVFTGRQNHAVTSLLLAAAVMVWWQPLTLPYDIGFQLSFLSTAGLIFVSPFLEKAAVKLPDFFGLKEAFLLTVSAQIVVVPIISLHFGRLSLIAPLANMAVAPFIVFSMAAGFMAVLGGFLSPGLGIFLGLPAYFSLSFILQIAHLGSLFPWADTAITVSGPWAVLYYFFLVALLIYLHISRSTEISPSIS